MKTKLIALNKRIKAILEPNRNQYQREWQSAQYLIISQPTCGRTWLRVMIGYIFQEISGIKTIDPQNLYYFSELNPEIPAIKPVHEIGIFKRQENYNNKKVILLTRDPRDAVLSNWHKKQKINASSKDENFNINISNHIRDSHYIERMIKLYNFWIEHRDIPRAFLLLRYEDMVESPKRELKRVMEFLGLSISDEVIAKAVEFASLKKMKKIVTKGNQQSVTTQKEKRGARHKIGKGKAGYYKEELAAEDIAFIEQQLHEKLNHEYGYNYFTNS